MFKSISRKSVLTDTVYVTFICPVTMKMARCGDDGKGFEVQKPKEALVRAMPYIKGGLQLLKVGVGVGRCLGLPIPNVGEALGGAIGAEAEHVEALLSEMGDRVGGEIDGLSFVESGAEMGKLLGEGWEKKCGLVFVTADDGASEWVLPDVEEKFKKLGSELLGGAVEAEDTGREELEEENEKLKKTIESTRLMDEMNRQNKEVAALGKVADGSMGDLGELTKLFLEAEKKREQAEKKREEAEARIERMLSLIVKKVQEDDDDDEEEDVVLVEEEEEEGETDAFSFGNNPMEVAKVRAKSVENSGSSWKEEIDPTSGQAYWTNIITGVSQWERPDGV